MPLAATGCAGFRGGWESVPYVGEMAPAQPAREQALAFPGITLRIAINNRLRTRDTQVMLYVVPVSIDPRDAYSAGPAPGRTRVFLNADPQAEGWVFRPSTAVLSFGGRSFTSDAGQEFGRWDDQGRRVERGGRWDHRPVHGEKALTEIGRRQFLSVDFATPVPDPKSRDIVLDISRCLVASQQPTLPLVRFVPARWEEGYT